MTDNVTIETPLGFVSPLVSRQVYAGIGSEPSNNLLVTDTFPQLLRKGDFLVVESQRNLDSVLEEHRQQQREAMIGVVHDVVDYLRQQGNAPVEVSRIYQTTKLRKSEYEAVARALQQHSSFKAQYKNLFSRIFRGIPVDDEAPYQFLDSILGYRMKRPATADDSGTRINDELVLVPVSRVYEEGIDSEEVAAAYVDRNRNTGRVRIPKGLQFRPVSSVALDVMTLEIIIAGLFEAAAGRNAPSVKTIEDALSVPYYIIESMLLSEGADAGYVIRSVDEAKAELRRDLEDEGRYSDEHYQRILREAELFVHGAQNEALNDIIASELGIPLRLDDVVSAFQQTIHLIPSDFYELERLRQHVENQRHFRDQMMPKLNVRKRHIEEARRENPLDFALKKREGDLKKIMGQMAEDEKEAEEKQKRQAAAERFLRRTFGTTYLGRLAPTASSVRETAQEYFPHLSKEELNLLTTVASEVM